MSPSAASPADPSASTATAAAPAPVTVRPGRPDDVPELLDIYNHQIVTSVSPLHLEPRTLAMWEQWFADHQTERHPLLVADVDGRPVGYACLSVFRPPAAYLTTAELSIYVHRDVRGRGVATRLMESILTQVRGCGSLHAVVSHVTGDNEASQRLHRKMGFTLCGTLREAALKFGRYHDVHVYQLLLEEDQR